MIPVSTTCAHNLIKSSTCALALHDFCRLGVRLTMPAGSPFKRRDSDVSDKPTRPNVLTRSPPASPQASNAKSRPRDPYPVPSSNPSNQYTLLEKLGTGSFGTVFKAIHNETKQIVAIKQIGELIMLERHCNKLAFLQQIWRTRMMTSPKYSRKSPVLLSAIRTMSPGIMAPSSLPTNFGLSWSTSLAVPASTF